MPLLKHWRSSEERPISAISFILVYLHLKVVIENRPMSLRLSMLSFRPIHKYCPSSLKITKVSSQIAKLPQKSSYHPNSTCNSLRSAGTDQYPRTEFQLKGRPYPVHFLMITSHIYLPEFPQCPSCPHPPIL